LHTDVKMIDQEKILGILSRAPFHLDEEAVHWVREKMAGLSLREKVSQLINLQVLPGSASAMDDVHKHQLGAVSVINFSNAEECKALIDALRATSKTPLLVCADLEGGVTSGHMTTMFPNQLGCAAANSLEMYKKALQVLARELEQLGVNWTFSPVLDVNEKFTSAIVGTRSYGTDLKTIDEMSNAHVEVFQANAIATTAKHWPGEGFDDRDQHLVTTVNPLSVDQWMDKFGRLYRRIIENGVLTVMSAHIAFPAYAKSRGAVGIEAYRPASLSAHLNESLLRQTLQFNGVIISDATLMGGLSSWGSRRNWLPEVIQNGCDMILFSEAVDEDIEILLQAVQSGALTHERLDLALARVLGLKAKLQLHTTPFRAGGTVSSVDSTEHRAVIEQLSLMSPTLVKDTGKILPINQDQIKKILVIKEENINPLGDSLEFRLSIDQYLAEEGFEVTVFNPATNRIDEHLHYDLVIYAIAQESQLTKSRIFLDWSKIHGGAMPAMKRTWWNKPTIFISFGHPYYLYDAPRIPCLINAYTPTQCVQRAVVEKLLGRSEFMGKSPVDAFCGLDDARY
jgi:beta-N-acetylhexosaminidase